MKSNNFLLGILAFFPLFFTSCNDSELAKKLDGSWEGSYTISSADGSKEKVQSIYSFNYDESRKDDDGTFVAMLIGHRNEADPGFDGTITFEYQSQIEGRWEVLMGTLYLYYDMNSLEVSVDPDKIKVKFDNDMDQLDYINGYIDYFSTTLRTPMEDLAKEAKKDVYESLFIQYNQHDDDEGYPDLEVSDNEMSFETQDLGRMVFHRIEINSSEAETTTSTPRATIDEDSESKTSYEKKNMDNLQGYVGKYPITMNLSIDGDKVSGSYYYNSSHSELKLSGTLNGNHIKLNETTEEGRPTGHFDGVISNDAISGEFINYKGEHFNFNVSSDSGGYKENMSSHRIGEINDPDGYTNVRSEPSTSSDIVTKMYEGEVFSYEPFNDKWVKVYDDDDDFIGYIAASRVRPIR